MEDSYHFASLLKQLFYILYSLIESEGDIKSCSFGTIIFPSGNAFGKYFEE